MSVAEMSEHQGGAGQNLGRLYKCYNDGIHTCTCIKVDKYNVQNCPIASWLISPHGLCICDEQTLQILKQGPQPTSLEGTTVLYNP